MEISRIKVLATGSKGNCYLIQASSSEKLLLECGIVWKDIQKGLDFDICGIQGCLLSHHHGDHSQAHKQVNKYGIGVYTNSGTITHIKPTDLRKYHIKENELFKIGNFTIQSFRTYHTNTDGSECPSQGFLIYHKNLGKILFATDTYKLPKFKNVDHILFECNYSDEVLDEVPGYKAKRLIKSHMSLENLKETIKGWDLSTTKDITLIHLSSDNGDLFRFKEDIEKLTGIPTHIAVQGLEITTNI